MTSRQSEGERELPERKVFYSVIFVTGKTYANNVCVPEVRGRERERD